MIAATGTRIFTLIFRQTKPDSRIKVPDISIRSTGRGSKIAFINVNILDSTGSDLYRGDVLIEGQRIVSVGTKLTAESLSGVRVFEGKGRTLMSGLCKAKMLVCGFWLKPSLGDAHTHFSWTNSDSLDGLADMPVEEHTLFSAQSARTFLDCGYTMCRMWSRYCRDRVVDRILSRCRISETATRYGRQERNQLWSDPGSEVLS